MVNDLYEKDRATLQRHVDMFLKTRNVKKIKTEVHAMLTHYPTQTLTTKFSFSFNTQKLQKEINNMDKFWFDQNRRYQYQKKDWETINLRAPYGDPADQSYTHPSPIFADTPALTSSPYFQEVLSFFQCPTYRIRISRMRPGVMLIPHVDLDTLRFHVVIKTNPFVLFLINDEKVVMKEGELWFLDTSYCHSVANNGTDDRLHMLIDVDYNDWVESLFPPFVPIHEVTTQKYKNGMNLRAIAYVLKTKNVDTVVKLITQNYHLLT